MHAFPQVIVSLGELGEEINGGLESWKLTLEAYAYLSLSQTKYMECKFSKMQNTRRLEVKVGEHIIPQVTLFENHGSIIQNKKEIVYVNHLIEARCLK